MTDHIHHWVYFGNLSSRVYCFFCSKVKEHVDD